MVVFVPQIPILGNPCFAWKNSRTFQAIYSLACPRYLHYFGFPPSGVFSVVCKSLALPVRSLMGSYAPLAHIFPALGGAVTQHQPAPICCLLYAHPLVWNGDQGCRMPHLHSSGQVLASDSSRICQEWQHRDLPWPEGATGHSPSPQSSCA